MPRPLDIPCLEVYVVPMTTTENTTAQFLPGDLVTVCSGVYVGTHGTVDKVENDEFGTDVSVRVNSAPIGIFYEDPSEVALFVHVEPTELCA